MPRARPGALILRIQNLFSVLPVTRHLFLAFSGGLPGRSACWLRRLERFMLTRWPNGRVLVKGIEGQMLITPGELDPLRRNLPAACVVLNKSAGGVRRETG